MKKRRRHSLSIRLLGLFILAALLLAIVVRTGFQFAFTENLRDLTRPHMAEYVQHLLDQLGDPPRIERAKEMASRLPVDIFLVGPGERWSSTGHPPPPIRPERWHRHRLPDGRPVHVARAGDGFRLRTRVGEHRVVMIPHGIQPGEKAPLLAIVTIIGVILVIIIIYHLIRRLFRPVEEIRAGVARIGGGDFRHRIHIDRRDELGELASSINAMADDIEQMLEAKRQLLLAISHELRSPLTRAKVKLELLEQSKTSISLEHDLSEMESLLNELLETERLNSRHAPLNLTASDPTLLIEEVIAEYFPEEKIEQELQPAGTYISLDPMRIKLLIKNLLANALSHSPKGGEPPGISSKVQEDGWQLAVLDHGPGIPAEHLAHICEPFYRVDAARQRETGGYGLGLYLCRVIAEAHGGKLLVENGEQGGTKVSMRLPLEGE